MGVRLHAEAGSEAQARRRALNLGNDVYCCPDGSGVIVRDGGIGLIGSVRRITADKEVR